MTLLWVGLAAGQAAAQTPEEIIRWVYQSQTLPGPATGKGIAHLSSPAQRAQFFSKRMVAFFAANDSYGNDLANACLGFGLDIPGNDFDVQEIARTLALSTTTTAGRQSVTASFRTFGQPAQVVYDFISEGGFLRIDDIAGPGWRVSNIACTPKATGAATAPASGSYCYMSGDDRLRLNLNGDASAVFQFYSWTPSGHSCSGQGLARAMTGGWVFADDSSRYRCRLGIAVTAYGSISLSDPGNNCKMTMCGQRATIDGLRFARETQVDCAQMPQFR